MAKHKVTFTHRKQRAVLTDMLPFEVPPTFSNRGFYKFLKEREVELKGGSLYWVGDDDSADLALLVIFGLDHASPIQVQQVTQWGGKKTVRSVKVPSKAKVFDTLPFNFLVTHKFDGRVLSVVHPRNQVKVAAFYAEHGALITYYSSLSEFSIRRPIAVSRYSYFKDKLHEERLESPRSGVEEEDREYEQLGSYFVYRKYRNIHRFFESTDYHRCEKRYDGMIQVDVSKCFDSIYTHSIAWAIFGKAQTKFSLEDGRGTFADNFDKLMQGMNYSETNGIVIGPEFSRIFAEIILQSVDEDLRRRLRDEASLAHKVDYEIFRYVDDFFVFYNQESTQLKVIETLQDSLRQKKLSINASKIKKFVRPIITDLTVAKERVSALLSDGIQIDCSVTENADGSERKSLSCALNTSQLILQLKITVKETKVQYEDLLNYTFAILENKLDRLLRCYKESDRTNPDQKRLVNALLALSNFAFFAYAASPRVNHTIRLCRMMSVAVNFLNRQRNIYDLKHLVFKSYHDNVVERLRYNRTANFRDLESLYLLTSLSILGKEYWLPESLLVEYFGIQEDPKTQEYFRGEYLNHFSITVLLGYMRVKSRYKKLRRFIEAHVLAKAADMKPYCPNGTEAMLLLLDMITCPYVSNGTKQAVAGLFGLDANDLQKIRGASSQWFTAWERFDLGRELDAKRSREVY